MTDAADTTDKELPLFPTSVPALFCDPDATAPLIADVLERLAAVIDVDDAQVALPTPCDQYNVDDLRQHLLGWLQFFAAALGDPAATSGRPDPDAFVFGSDALASDIVRKCSTDIQQAIAADAAGQAITMSSSRMAGDGVLAMALGEYIIHAWDLATATGRRYDPPTAAVAPAHEFLLGMVKPEYRGPDTGFFDAEVEVPDDAPPLDRLLGFAGRDPSWTR